MNEIFDRYNLSHKCDYTLNVSIEFTLLEEKDNAVIFTSRADKQLYKAQKQDKIQKNI